MFGDNWFDGIWPVSSMKSQPKAKKPKQNQHNTEKRMWYTLAMKKWKPAGPEQELAKLVDKCQKHKWRLDTDSERKKRKFVYNWQTST